MWDTIIPHTSGSWEPIELQMLKQELAHLNCRCNACETYKNASLHNAGYQSDEAVQVEIKNNLTHNIMLDKYIYAESERGLECEHPRSNMANYLRKDIFCPNCFFIWDLLKKTTKVLKDEESEMKPESSDKATERVVIFADSATSVTKKRPVNLNSNLSLCDFISESSSRSSLSPHIESTFEFEHYDKKKNNHHDRVTFLDDCVPGKDFKKEPPTFHIQGNCFCIENYMDAIRPPYDS